MLQVKTEQVCGIDDPFVQEQNNRCRRYGVAKSTGIVLGVVAIQSNLSERTLREADTPRSGHTR